MSGAPHTQTERQGKWIGGGIALLFHLLLVLFFVTTGFRTLHPIPQNEWFLVDFLPDPTPILPQATPGEQPRTPDPDPEEEVRLVQQATHTEEVPSEVRTQQSTPGETGEVEIYEPPPPKPIDQRALYRSRDTGDTLAEQSSRTTSTTMQAGAPDGNTRQGNPDGTPAAALPGRNVVGALPLPDYTANAGGIVVVQIMVDQYGNVTGATVTQTGTTVQNKTLWDAAVKAAKKAKFTRSDTAPVVQKGTITYVFTLK